MIGPFCDEMRDISSDMQWKYDLFDQDLNKPNTSYFDEDGEIKGHLPLKGILIRVHPKCETLSFLFDSEGNIRNLVLMVVQKDLITGQFVKTQFAPFEIHIVIVKLLKYLSKKYFESFEVIDEGEYWQTGDEELLKANLEFLGEVITVAGNLINEELDRNSESEEPMLERIERILKERFGIKRIDRYDL